MHTQRTRPGAILFGLLAYASFGISLLWLLGFLSNVEALPVTIDRGPVKPLWLAAPIDIALVALFGLQHSVMARPWFKQRWTRIVPQSLERSTYVLISSALTLLLCIAWQPIPAVVWAAETVLVNYLAWLAFGIGLLVLIAASFQIDHWALLGLRQTWNASRGTESPSSEFTLRGFYRFVRHPIYLGWLLLFWITPQMSGGHLLLAASMTLYTMIAIRFEERDLVCEHGTQYADYQADVPALVPRPRLQSRAPQQLLSLAVLALMAVSADRIGAAESGEWLTLQADGRERTTLVVKPSPDTAQRKLVLMLHGAGGAAGRIRQFTAFGLEQQARNNSWVVAYPEGIGGTWNDCRRSPAYPAHVSNIDDVGFLAKLIETLRSRYGIAAKDVLVAGFSNGGQMALRLAIEQPESIGGIAVVAAQMPTAGESVCGRTMPAIRSVWINGDADPFIPAGGGPSVGPDGSSLGEVMSLFESTEAMASTNPAVRPQALRPVKERDGDPLTSVIQKDWTGPDGLYLRQIVLRGSGHVIPQRTVAFPPIVGHPAGDIDFGEVVAEFLSDSTN